jgi:hypothetical protein
MPLAMSVRSEFNFMTTVEYQLTKRELVLTGTLRKLRQVRIIIGMSLLLLCAILLLVAGGSFRILGWFLLTYVLVFPLLLMRTIHQQINANPVFTSKTKLSFGESGLVSVANGMRSERSWQSLKSWSQSKEHFFLHTDNLGTAVTIPKRAFTNQQTELFLNEVKRIQGRK